MASWFLQTIILNFLNASPEPHLESTLQKSPILQVTNKTEEKKIPIQHNSALGTFKRTPMFVRIPHYYGSSTVLWQDTACSLNSKADSHVACRSPAMPRR